MKKYELAMRYILEQVVPSLEIGSRLPPEAALARASGVSLLTLRRAIEELCHQGVLSRIPEHRAVLASNGTSIRSGAGEPMHRILLVRLSEEVYYSELLLALQQAMLESGRFNPILYEFTSPRGTAPEAALSNVVLEMVQSAQAHAVLMLPMYSGTTRLEARLAQYNIPLLGLLGYEMDCRNRLVIDFAAGTYHGLRYLYESGCRNLRFAGLCNESPRQRGAGAVRFFREYFPDLKLESMIVEAHGYFEDGYAAFERIHAADPNVDGIFAHNDLCAGGIIMAAEKHGKHIPRDLSIIGFDDLARSRSMVPRLTSMAVPARDIAFEAIDALDLLFRQGPGTTSIRALLQPQLYLRDSVRTR